MLFSKEQMRKLIVPLIIEQILAVAVGMIDTMMVSSVGEAAVSGVSLVDNISILIIGLFGALATGGAVVAGQYLGQNDEKNACKAAEQLVLFITVSSLVIMMILLLLHPLILTRVFGTIDANVMADAKTYLIITAFSIPMLAIYNGCAALFRDMGNSKVTMYISLIMNAINAIGNAVLIFGFKMGVAGAAIPTLVSRTVAAVIILVLLFQPARAIHFDRHFDFRFHWRMIQRILYIGIPNGLENSIFQLGKILTLSLVSTCGTAAIAANAVASNVAMLNTLPGNALGMAMLSVVSICVGAGAFDQVKFYTKELMKKIRIYIGIISVFLFVLSPYIVSVYNLSPEAAASTQLLIRYYAVCTVLIWPESFAITNTLRASNDATFTMAASIASMWIFRIGFSYIFVKFFDMGVFGVWVAMTIDWVFRAVLFMTRYMRGKWMTKYVKTS